MEALLTSHIESLAHPASPVRVFIRKHSGLLGTVSGALFFLGSVYGALWGTDLFVREGLDRVRKSLEIAKDVSSKVTVLAEYIASGDANRHYFSVGLFLIIAFIISIFVAITIADQADSEEPSFVLITTGALRMQQKQMRRIRAQWKRFLASILISLCTNIVSSYIFIHLSRNGI